MKNFNIIPVHFVAENRKAESADDAIIGFAAQMDSDMNNYFKAVPAEDTSKYLAKQIVAIIRTNTLSADDCSEIFRALGKQDAVLGGKLFTTQDIINSIEDNYNDSVVLSASTIDKIAGCVNQKPLEDCDDKEWNTIADAIEESNVKIHITDIKWDVDEEDFDDEAEYHAVVENELPSEVDVPLSQLRYNVEITDWLSDNYGYLVKSFEIEEAA